MSLGRAFKEDHGVEEVGDSLNHDPFWYIINPEQHTMVIDQERLDYVWRAKQTAWHDLIDRLHIWGAIVQFESDTRNVTRKNAQQALRRVLPRNSRNVLDAHITRMQALGILRRLENGLYRVSFAHAGAAILWEGQTVPAILREGTDERGRERRLLEAAREFAAGIQDTEEMPKAGTFGVTPFVPNPGGQGRTTPAYQAAFDLWRFSIHNARLWEEVVGVPWMAPALGRTAGIKEWVRDHGTRRGSDALQDFVDLGRACGILHPTDDRTKDQAMPGFAPVINRLMWELLPGTVTAVNDAIPIADEIHDHFQEGFPSTSPDIAAAWHSHIGFKYMPSAAPPASCRVGSYITWSAKHDPEDVACPMPTILGRNQTPGDPGAYNESDGIWWERLIGRVEKTITSKPQWRHGVALPLPNALPVPLRLPAVRREPDIEATVAEVGVAIAKFDVQTVAIAVAIPKWDMPGRNLEGPAHRIDLWLVFPNHVDHFTGDLKTVNGRPEFQRWLPAPADPPEEVAVDALQSTMRILGDPDDRAKAREALRDIVRQV